MERAATERRRRREAGYTLLLVVFLAALMIIAASVALPNMITQDRRRKETLMIWRGEQYARAIGLYYRKTGRFPHDLKELSQNVSGIYVLRQKYKDPMSSDGAWRLIYLGPGGQLLGSLRWHTLAEYEAYEKGQPLPGTEPGPAGNPAPAPGAEGVGTATFGAPGTGTGEPKPRIYREGDMIGGNLIGVGSLVDAKSLKVYNGADNYRDWEFIWNPVQGQVGGGLPGAPANGNPKPGSPVLGGRGFPMPGPTLQHRP